MHVLSAPDGEGYFSVAVPKNHLFRDEPVSTPFRDDRVRALERPASGSRSTKTFAVTSGQ